MNTPDFVTCCKVQDPTGTVIVERSKLVPRPSVYAIIRNRDGKHLMIRGAKNNRLTLSGGGVNASESFQNALAREVKEESGLQITNLSFWKQFENFVCHEADNVCWHVFHSVFVCEVADDQVPLSNKGNPDDEGMPEWVDLKTVTEAELQNIYKDIVPLILKESGKI